MIMRFVDNIPEQFIPPVENHIEHQNVVRALINNKCDVGSFLPTFLEPSRMNSAFFDENDPENYSLSLYTSIEKLNEAVRFYKRFWIKHKGYAIGKTSILRGIALKENSDGHISFFLFDTFNNSPCDDFRVVI